MTTAPHSSLPDILAESKWYPIQTRYRFERKVTAQLQQKGLKTFLPLLEEIHHWSDRRQTISIPLFGGYTFVQIDLSSRLRLDLLRTQGVVGFITFNGEATPIPTKQVDDLRALLSRKVPCALHPFLKVGRPVRIRGGCLDGLEGILEQSGAKNLVISVASIQRSVAIKIEGYQLEMI